MRPVNGVSLFITPSMVGGIYIRRAGIEHHDTDRMRGLPLHNDKTNILMVESPTGLFKP